jgi:hypothetical protein
MTSHQTSTRDRFRCATEMAGIPFLSFIFEDF